MRLEYLIKILILSVLLIVTENSNAQRKDIIISEYLSDNSEMLRVKVGTQWMGRIWNFKFGDYAVVRKSKMSPQVSDYKSNILGTKNDYKTGYKFNFTLTNNSVDSATVNALYGENIKELSSFELFPDFYLGRDEVLKDSINFIAEISLSSNTSEIWKLSLEMTSGTETELKHVGVLTNDTRIIWINPVSSNRDGNDKRLFPALGYEFTENGNAICAVQYFGGGAFGYNKNRVWIDSNLNHEMKLILAASMTSILQIKQPTGE